MSTNATSLKHASLVLLAVQNLACGLIMPLCRKPDAMGNVFFAPTCVVIMELLKMLVSYSGLTWKHYSEAQHLLHRRTSVYLPVAVDDHDDSSSTQSTLSSATLNEDYAALDIDEKADAMDGKAPALLPTAATTYNSTVQDCMRSAFNDCWQVGALRMAVPSLLYVVQNNLQIFSAGYLTPAEFQVFSQMKLITTAVFLVVLLNRKLTAQHWMCIVALCFGIILVKGADELLNGFKADALSHPGLWRIGFPAILGASLCSGLAGVYLEMQLKGKQSNFWANNAQLAGFSLLPAMAPIVLDSYRRGAIDPFRYFNGLVWAMILINVAGGILVAMVIKYADNILKGFAVSVSLILTIFVSSYITGVPLTAYQLIGGTVVAASTFIYGQTKAAV